MVTAECSGEEKASLDSISDSKTPPKIHLTSYLRSDRIFFLQETSRDSALHTLVQQTKIEALIPKEKFLKALLDRERLVSTGIGMGVAIPHAKMAEFADFFITVGIQKKRGLSWKSLDGSVVSLIFMIGGPDHKQSEYLQILSKLTYVIKQEVIRKRMLQSSAPEEVLALFQDF